MIYPKFEKVSVKNKIAFMVEGVVMVDEETYVREMYASLIKDFMELWSREDQFTPPTITKGFFTGHRNEGGWYIGEFKTNNGRKFNIQADGEYEEIKAIIEVV